MKDAKYIKVTIVTDNGIFTFVNPEIILVAEDNEIKLKYIKEKSKDPE